MTLEFGILLAVLLQTGTIAWWASGINSMVKNHERRLEVLENWLKDASGDAESSPAGRALLERIARLEGKKS